MRWRRAHCVGIAFLLLLAVAGRFAWHVSSSAIGWQVVAEGWRETVRRMTGQDVPPLAARHPAAQAEFWLEEVERILGRTDPTADQLAGAAWMLDGPQYDFLVRHIDGGNQKLRIPEAPPAWRPELNEASVGRAVEQFESLCRDRCLELIRRASELDPDNPELWRMRAQLLFDLPLFTEREGGPRREDWLAVLDECAEHDPENALYDYLAAGQLWSESASYRFEAESGSYVLEIGDERTYQAGLERWRRGQQKPRLMFGTDAYQAAWALTRRTDLGPLEQMRSVWSRNAINRAVLFLPRLRRWTIARADSLSRQGRFGEQAAAYRSLLRVAQQIHRLGNPPDVYYRPRSMLNSAAASSLIDLAEERAGLFTDEERTALQRQWAEARLETEVLLKAGVFRETHATSHPTLLSATGSGLGQTSAIWLGLTALVSAGLARLMARSESAAIDSGPPIRHHLAAWGAGLALSFGLFGLCPAGLIPPAAQPLALRSLLGLGCALMAVALCLMLRRRLGLSGRSLLAILGLAILLVISLSYATLMAVTELGMPPALAIGLLALAVLGAWGTLRWGGPGLNRSPHTGGDPGKPLGLTFALMVLLVIVGLALVGYLGAAVPQRAWIPPRGTGEQSLTGAELQTALEMENHPWLWALLQWGLFYPGLAGGAVAALGGLALWTTLRRLWRREGGLWKALRGQRALLLSSAGRAVAGSAGAAAVLGLLVYLALTPRVLEEADARYRRYREPLENPAAVWERADDRLAEVRNDPEMMEELRRRVANER